MEAKKAIYHYHRNKRQNASCQNAPTTEQPRLKLSIRVRVNNYPNGLADNGQTEGSHSNKHPQELVIVFTSNAVVQVFAVMIEILDTSIALFAVITLLMNLAFAFFAVHQFCWRVIFIDLKD